LSFSQIIHPQVEKGQLYPVAPGDGQLGVKTKIEIAIRAGVIMLDEKSAGGREELSKLCRGGGNGVWMITYRAHQRIEAPLAGWFFLLGNG